MAIKLTSLTLNTPNPGQIIEFYSCLGFEFKSVSVQKGGQHHKARHQEIEFCVFEKPEKTNSHFPVLQLGFNVSDLKMVHAKLSRISGVSVLMEPTMLPAGYVSVLKDPDGNSVEITERS